MDNKGVLVIAEIVEGKLAPVTIELLGAGRKLADDLGEELSALLLGSKAGGLAKDAIAYGADKVHVAEDGVLDEYNSDAYTQVAADHCQKAPPAIVLRWSGCGDTSARSCRPASRWGAGLPPTWPPAAMGPPVWSSTGTPWSRWGRRNLGRPLISAPSACRCSSSQGLGTGWGRRRCWR